MRYSLRCVAAGAAMILKNRPEIRFEDAEAFAAWTIAGLLQTPPDPPPAISVTPPGPLPTPLLAAAAVSVGNIHEAGPTALGGPPEVMRKQAQASGYTGNACDTCGNFTLQRTGTCVTCATCGANSGCG